MSGGCSKRGVAGRADCRVRGMRTTCRERPRTAGRGRPWQPCGRDASASRHLRLGTRPWFGCMRGTQGRPGRCCVWSARPSRPSGAAPVPFRRSFSDFWLENDFLFWPFYGLFDLKPPFNKAASKYSELQHFGRLPKFEMLDSPRFMAPGSKYSKSRYWLNIFRHDVYYWESASFADRLLLE